MQRERETHRPLNPDHGLTERDVMSVAEVARLLGCSRRQVYLLAEQDQLPGARRLGRTLLVVRPVLERWLLTGTVES